jgi:PEGA domain/Tetratricopeptide repeat
MSRVLTISLALCVTTYAAPADKEAGAHYSAGNRAFEEGDFAKAIDELKQSVAAKPTVKAYLVLGNAYLKMGQLDESRGAFEKVLEIDPKSSKRKLVEQHIKDLTTLAKTKLAVATTPPGATIYVDLKAEGARGKAPASLPVLPGKHRVMLELEGYEPATLETVAVEGQDVPVTATLKLRGCDLTVTTLPDKAELRVDNGDPQTTPATVRVAVGDHTLTLTAPGWLTKSHAVSCPAEKQALTVTETLEQPPTAILMVRAAGASVHIDGQAVADAGRLVLPAGRHEVMLEAPGKAPWRASMTLQKGQEMELAPSLDAPAAPPKKTRLIIASGIPFAQAAIDGQVAVPGQPREVTPGAHFVDVRARGYEPYRSQVNVNEGDDRVVSTHLERRGLPALMAGLAFSMLTLGAVGTVIAAHYSANRELPGTGPYDDWHRVELAGYGLTGSFGGLAVICFIAGATQASTGGGAAESKGVAVAPTANGLTVAGRF